MAASAGLLPGELQLEGEFPLLVQGPLARGHGLRRGAAVLLAAACLTCIAEAAHAIPSPELVIGTLSSVSQLFAVVSAVLGGGAVAAGVSAAGRSGVGRTTRRPRAVRWLVGGMGLTAMVSLAGNYHQFTTASAARTERLEATLLRPAARGTDGKLLDPALRELSYEGQARHPSGISTADAAALISARPDRPDEAVVLVDIRETAEAEMGSLPGATKIRFPDLDPAALAQSGKTALLFCHNGNRSGETCASLAARGIPCRFIVGGLEKWLAEGRTLGAGGARSLADLRALPAYPNNRTLLDTAEVRRLIADAGAVFVDVRYRGEFDSGHLDGAINLPIRPLPSAELDRRLDALPRRPIIAPCYDRRSCFFGEILGLELTRRGRDFRGRYTVPWEYFVAPPRPPHVEQLLAAQSGRSGARGWWAVAADALATAVGAMRDGLGLPLAILALALLSRLLVLPFSLKAERDQRTARRIAPGIARLKAELADDPVRLGRALQASYRDHGLTPGRNLIALAFLPLMALSVEAVTRTAAATREPLLWLADVSAPDPTYALPIVFAVLAAVYMSVSLASRRRHHLVIWAIAAPLLAAGVALLSAAAAVYVVASMALLLLQRWLAEGGLRDLAGGFALALRRFRQWRLAHPGLVPLEDVARLAGVGNKALRLGEMSALGVPVPRGVVLSSTFLRDLDTMPARQRSRSLNRVWRHLGAAALAVRSSAVGEDGAEHSFAGVFDTRLDIERAGFEAAVLAVRQSFSDPRATPYAAGQVTGNVLVQPMVRARYAGVLFTEDPASAGAVLLEYVEGSGDALVSGRVQPSSSRYGRVTGQHLSGPVPPFDPSPLLALARIIERHYGAAQDIEWALADRGFVILQSRDITATAAHETSAVKGEWRRLLRRAGGSAPGEAVLVQNEMSELLPRPSPVSLSLIEALWLPGGSVDLAGRRLGIGYAAAEDGDSLYTTVFGRLYTDVRVSRRRGLQVGNLAARRLRSARRRSNGISDRSSRRARSCARDGPRPWTTPGWRREICCRCLTRSKSRFITETYVEAEVINIAAGFYLEDARKAAAAVGLDMSALATALPATAEQQAIRTALLAPAEWRGAGLMRAIGHRAPLDYELSQPRYGETPERLETTARAMLAADWEDSGALPESCLDGVPAPVRKAVARARRFEILKEDAKHHTLRELAGLRRMLLAIDARFALDGLVFDLSLDEIAALDPRSPGMIRQRAAERRDLHQALGAMPSLPRRLTPRDIEAAAVGATGGRPVAAGPLVGTCVSGRGVAEGRAFTVSASDAERGLDLDGFADGDILVSRMVPPSWLPYVLRSGGVLTEVGGWLSHMAIVARERGIVMIVGCDGLEGIAMGTPLRLHPDGRIEARPAVEAPRQGVAGGGVMPPTTVVPVRRTPWRPAARAAARRSPPTGAD